MNAKTKTIAELMEIFRKGTTHLQNMAASMDFPWPSGEMDAAVSARVQNPREVHNRYARSLVTCYVSKYAQLSEAILDSVDDQRFLIYALAGRSLIESIATLRYYVLHQYKPLLDKGSISHAEMRQLIEIDDRHLRGGRFDWESFFSKHYQKLKEDAVKSLADKKAKQKQISNTITAEQVNVLTCIEKWADDTPEVLIAYSLFCDLVHPNIGSTFLVASTSDKGLYFTPTKGKSVGADIFRQSFPILVSVTHKQFGGYLSMLIGTIWADDEL